MTPACTTTLTHDSSRAKGGVEALGPARLLRRHRGSHVGVDRHLHAQVAAGHGGKGAQEETDGSEETARHVPPGSPGHQHKDENRKAETEPKANLILRGKEGFGALVDGLVNLLETLRDGFIVAVANETGRLTATAARSNGDLGDDIKLGQGPEEGDASGDDNQARCRGLVGPVKLHDGDCEATD